MRYGIYKHGRQTRRSLGHRFYGRLERFANYGLVAAWDTSRADTKTFNVNDISGLASIVNGSINLAQVVGANQPLGVGTPVYGEFTTIQFTAANADRLTNATDPGTGTGAAIVVFVPGNTTGDHALLIIDALRVYSNLSGIGAHWGSFNGANIDGGSVLAPGVPHVIAVVNRAFNDTTLWTDGVPVVQTNGSAYSNGTGITLGADGALQSTDMGFLLAAWFTTAPPDSVAIRISHALGARAGVAA